MAQSTKLVVKCDRCEREESRDLSAKRTKDDAASQFVATLYDADGASHGCSFGDLCSPCFQTILKHLASIEKKIDKKSPKRVSK